MTAPARLTLVVVADVAADGVETFQRYEAAVLPLLGRHGGRVERRLRTEDEFVEVHVLSFASRAGFEAYAADPERAELRERLGEEVFTQRILDVSDVQQP